MKKINSTHDVAQRLYIMGLTSIAVFSTFQVWAQEPPTRFSLSSFQGASRDVTAMSPEQLAVELNAGSVSTRQLVLQYMERIQRLDHSGPTLRSVTQINPDALSIADRMDALRVAAKAGGRALPTLFGIPILVKNNIDTDDRMYSTAGSLALIGSRPARDSMVATQLRDAGMLIMGKTNMSEWANYRAGALEMCQQKGADGSCKHYSNEDSFSGQGGVVLNPRDWRLDPSGSSNGSAVAAAMDFAPIALGTETNGSIIGPSKTHGLIGLKPTPGLTSRTGVAPALFSTDTVGPMAESIIDVAHVLGSINKVDLGDAKSAAHPEDRPRDYTRKLNGDLKGLRIGVYFKKGSTAAEQASVKMLEAAGARLVRLDSNSASGFYAKALSNVERSGKFDSGFVALLKSEGTDAFANNILNLATAYEPKKYINAYLNGRIAAPEQYKSALVKLLGADYKSLARGSADIQGAGYVASTDNVYAFDKSNRKLELGKEGDSNLFERMVAYDTTAQDKQRYAQAIFQSQEIITAVLKEFRRLITDNTTAESGADALVGDLFGHNSNAFSQIAQLTMPLMNKGTLDHLEMNADPFQEETLLRIGYALEQQLKKEENAKYRVDKSQLVQQAWADQPIDNGPPMPLTLHNLDGNADLWTTHIAPLELNTPDIKISPVFDGRFHGAGALIKTGASTQAITGKSDFSGPVHIWEGGLRITRTEALGDIANTVRLEQGSALIAADTMTLGRDVILSGSGTLSADDGATLTIDKPISDLLPSMFSELNKAGPGALVLSAVNTYTGPTWVNQGLLAIDGAVNSAVTVNNHATLGGNGSLGALVVKAGGTVAPGHSIATLHTGDVTFEPGSFYAVEVATGGRSDLIDSSGVANLKGGTVNVSLENSANLLTLDEAKPLIGQTFTILNAKKGIQGTFSQYMPNYLFLDSQVGDPATRQVLEIKPPPVESAPSSPLIPPLPAVTAIAAPNQPAVIATPVLPVTQPLPAVAVNLAPVKLATAVVVPSQTVQPVSAVTAVAASNQPAVIATPVLPVTQPLPAVAVNLAPVKLATAVVVPSQTVQPVSAVTAVAASNQPAVIATPVLPVTQPLPAVAVNLAPVKLPTAVAAPSLPIESVPEVTAVAAPNQPAVIATPVLPVTQPLPAVAVNLAPLKLATAVVVPSQTVQPVSAVTAVAASNQPAVIATPVLPVTQPLPAVAVNLAPVKLATAVVVTSQTVQPVSAVTAVAASNQPAVVATPVVPVTQPLPAVAVNVVSVQAPAAVVVPPQPVHAVALLSPSNQPLVTAATPVQAVEPESTVATPVSSVQPPVQVATTTATSAEPSLAAAALEQPTPAVAPVTTLNISIKRNQTSFASVAATRNERAVAAAADNLAAGNPVSESLIKIDSVELARQAFKQLDGQVHSDAAAAQITDSRYIRDAVNARLQQSQALNTGAQIEVDESNGGWVQLLGGHTSVDSDHNAASYSTSTTGVLLGLDTEVGDGWRAGAATGYTQTDLTGSSKASANSDSYHLSVYGGKHFDNIALRLGGATTWHRIDTSRSVVYGSQSAHTKATYNARTDQVFGEIGYTGWSAFEPFTSLTYINFQSDAFKERGRAAALQASKQSQNATLSTLGVRGQTRFAVSATHSVNLRGELGWEHQYGGLGRETSLKFTGSEAAFAVNSVPVSRDGAVAKATAEIAMTQDMRVSLNYTGLLSRQGGGNAVNLGFTFEF